MIFVIVDIKGVPGFKFLNAKLFLWRFDRMMFRKEKYHQTGKHVQNYYHCLNCIHTVACMPAYIAIQLDRLTIKAHNGFGSCKRLLQLREHLRYQEFERGEITDSSRVLCKICFFVIESCAVFSQIHQKVSLS